MVQVHQYVSLIDLPASGNRASKLAIFSDLGGSLVFLFKTFSTNRKPEPQRAAYPVETPAVNVRLFLKKKEIFFEDSPIGWTVFIFHVLGATGTRWPNTCWVSSLISIKEEIFLLEVFFCDVFGWSVAPFGIWIGTSMPLRSSSSVVISGELDLWGFGCGEGSFLALKTH